MLTGRSYTTSLGRPCLRESEASAGEFPLVFDGLGVFRGHFYRVIDFPNPRQNCHRTTLGDQGLQIVSRLMGLFVCALAAQIIVTGLKGSLFPG